MSSKLFVSIIAIGMLTLSVNLFAAGAANSVTVHDPYIRAVPPGLTNSASYMVLENNGSENTALVGGESSAAKVIEVHNHINDNGVMRMRRVDKIDVPAGGKAALEPGGYHVMFIGLTDNLVPNSSIDVTLKFADGSEKQIKMDVRKLQMKMTKGTAKHSMH